MLVGGSVVKNISGMFAAVAKWQAVCVCVCVCEEILLKLGGVYKCCVSD